MSIFDRIIKIGNDLIGEAEKEFSRLVDKGSFDRACQAAFLIARADGMFDDKEKAALQKILSSKLPNFKAADILAAIQRAQEELIFTVEGGIGSLLSNIARSKGTDDAALIMLVAVAIGAADGDFDDAEKAMARRIADALGIPHSQYGL